MRCGLGMVRYGICYVGAGNAHYVYQFGNDYYVYQFGRVSAPRSTRVGTGHHMNVY